MASLPSPALAGEGAEQSEAGEGSLRESHCREGPHPNPPPQERERGRTVLAAIVWLKPRSPLPWIKRIAQAVADQVERQHHKKNRQSRPNRHPRRVGQEALRGIEYAAPGGRGRLLAEPRLQP